MRCNMYRSNERYSKKLSNRFNGSNVLGRTDRYHPDPIYIKVTVPAK